MYKIYDAYQYFCQNGNWTIPEMVALYQSNCLLKEPKVKNVNIIVLLLIDNNLLRPIFKPYNSKHSNLVYNINRNCLNQKYLKILLG